jgi:PAS domain S-box-containing protein
MGLYEDSFALISPVGIFRTDDRGRTTYVNRSWCALSGLSEAEALGYGWLSAVHPEDRQKIAEGWDAAAASHAQSRAEYRFLRPDGAVIWVVGLATPEHGPDGTVLGHIGTVTDITDLKRTEALLRSTLREKETLLREVHHRVKNNLQVIISLLAMQSGFAGDPATKRFLNEIGAEARTMSFAYEQLSLSPDLSSVAMRPYLARVIAAFIGAKAIDHRIDIVLDVDELHMDIALAMPCGLLVNELITNAAKFAFPSPRFSGNPVIRVGLHEEDGAYRLFVEDNGVGLPSGYDWRQATTLGFSLVKVVALDQLGSSVVVGRESGLRFDISFARREGEDACRE